MNPKFAPSAPSDSGEFQLRDTAGQTVHATVVLVRETGVLIRGGSGSGKSGLALQLLSADPVGTRLVADDRVLLSAGGGRVVASVPAALAGLMEIRGQGIVRFPCIPSAVVRIVIDLMPVKECPRLPDAADATATVEGLELPLLMLPVGVCDGAERIRSTIAALQRR